MSNYFAKQNILLLDILNFEKSFLVDSATSFNVCVQLSLINHCWCEALIYFIWLLLQPSYIFLMRNLHHHIVIAVS